MRAIDSGIDPPTADRNPRDRRREEDYPDPPPANNGNGTIGTNPNKAAALQRDLEQMRQEGYTDIRVNQEQVNAQGLRVGQNRPDLQGTEPVSLQGTDSNGVRHYVEYDSDPARSAAHVQRIKSNDPVGIVAPKIVK